MKNNTISRCAAISCPQDHLLHFIRNIHLHAAGSLKQLLCLIASCFFLLSTTAQAPLITDFSPLSAPLNGTVTITGDNFRTDTAGNAVYIGGSRARVLAASKTSLTVQVLPGATSDILKITTNGLIGYSKKRFTVTFPSPQEITTGSFSSLTTLDAVSSNTAFGDLDGDGKQDMAIIYTRTLKPYVTNMSTVSIKKNTSSPGNISFNLSVTFRLPEAYKYSVYFNDLNSDGKPDLIVSPLNQPFLYYYKNISTLDNIDFSPARIINFPQPLNLIKFVDIDSDGKEDLIMTDERAIKFLVNTGSGDDIRYADPYTRTLDQYFFATAFDDLNGDGKTDIVVSAASPNVSFIDPWVRIITNRGTPGNLSFEYYMSTWANLNLAWNAQTADIDLDGKPDIVVTDGQGDSLAILKNRSTAPGSPQFNLAAKFQLDSSLSRFVKLQDVDGDGRLDIISAVYNINILKNTSNSSRISFTPKVILNTGHISSIMGIMDIDGDGQPDIVVGGYPGETTYVLRNQLKITTIKPSISSFSPSAANTNDTVVINGNNLQGATSVLFGNVPVKSFSIISDNKIKAVVGAGASGTVTVKNKIGSASAAGFTYLDQPSIELTYNIPDSACKSEELVFSAIIHNKPANAYFRMVKNNTQLGDINGIVSSSLIEGDKIWARLYISGKLVQSTDTVTIGYLQPVIKPTIKISQSKKEICKGSPVVFTATITGGSTAPIYQWYKNNIKVGLNQATYTDSLLNTGDSVFCILNIANRCAIVPVASTSLGITVYNSVPANPSLITGPSVVSPGQQGIQFSINPVNNVRTYQWQIPQGTSITAGKGTNAITVNWGSTAGKISIGLLNACGGSAVVTKSIAINSTASRIANNSNDNILKLADLMVYPNPANSKTTVVFSGKSDVKYIVQLRDASGKLLQSQKAVMIKGRISVTLNTANYLPGVYYVIVTNEFNEIESKRLLIGR